MYRYRLPLLLVILCLADVSPGWAGGLSAADVVGKAYELYGGDDTVAELEFKFQVPGKSERRLAYTMAWKRYEDGEFDSKVIFFTQFPPDKHGEAYMAWLYRPELHKDNEEWLYLPKLRSIRKLGHKAHQHDEEDDEFSKSVLKHSDLVPRFPDADRHHLLRKEQIDGDDYYVIESVPKEKGGHYDYSRTVRWIRDGDFLLTRVDYYDDKQELLKQQRIKWQHIDEAWVWDEVVATNVKNDNKTVLEVTDVRVNTGLNDRIFTKRTMRLGPGIIR